MGRKACTGNSKAQGSKAYLQDKSSFGGLSLSHLDGAKQSSFTRAWALQQQIVLRINKIVFRKSKVITRLELTREQAFLVINAST
jgi:hypothetical protein